MNFNSLAFLLYLPTVVVVYWLLPHKIRWVWLLAASWYFYMYWDARLIVLLLMTTVTSYAAAILIEKDPDHKKLYLTVTLIVCLGILAYFKYANFFIDSALRIVNAALGEHFALSLKVILPVGISFYTFQTLSYVIDVYRGDFPAERHFGYYALFVTYFPQLVAGPIENPRNLLPQLRAEHKINSEDMLAGCRQLLTGFFRKCAVADFIGIYVNQVYADLENQNALAVLLAGLLFCLQIYNDFAGYSEIAAGAARLMGVRLMRNFDRPYISQSPAEYFRRWHISLNRWFTDYLYIPLGGGRRGIARKVFNTFVVFILCGLWHGANWTYALWGLYCGVCVSLDAMCRKPLARLDEKLRIDNSHPAVKLVRWILMFIFYIPAGLMFRATSVAQIGEICVRVFTAWGGNMVSDAIASMGLNGPSILMLTATIFAMMRCYNFGVYDMPKAENGSVAAQRTATAVYFLLIIALSWIALLASSDNASFAYFQF